MSLSTPRDHTEHLQPKLMALPRNPCCEESSPPPPKSELRSFEQTLGAPLGYFAFSLIGFKRIP